MKCVIPVSGGMDSSIILHHVAKNLNYKEIYPISFNYGQRHSIELHYATVQMQQLPNHVKIPKVIDISYIKDIAPVSSITNKDIEIAKTKTSIGDPQTVNYVPFRNQMMLSICCSFAESIGAETVFHGAALVDSQAGYWDGSKEFLQKINELISLNRKNKIKIEAPLIEMSKKEIIELGISLKFDFEATHTCYSGLRPCDASNPASNARIKGFIDAGYIDPVPYKQNIDWEKYNCKPIVYED